MLRAFWGRYYEGTASAFFTAATPGIQDYIQTPINPDGSVAGPPEVDHAGVRLRHQRRHQAPADRRVQRRVGEPADAEA